MTQLKVLSFQEYLLTAVQNGIMNYVTVVPILLTVPNQYFAFMVCDRKKLFACLKEVLYKSQYIKSYIKQQAGH